MIWPKRSEVHSKPRKAVKSEVVASLTCSWVASHFRKESKGASSSAMRHSKNCSEAQSPVTVSGRRTLSEWSEMPTQSWPCAATRAKTSLGRVLTVPSE